MTVAWFCLFRDPAGGLTLSGGDRDALVDMLRHCPALSGGFVYTPADGAGALALVVELRFATVSACEAALSADGPLQALAQPATLPSLSGATVTQQAMLYREQVADRPVRQASSPCTYLVAYPGPAHDPQAWLDHYLGSHFVIMQRLPGLRAAAVYTPAVALSRLPFRADTAMLRNKVVFDDREGLDRALASPARDALRADVGAFPPFDGGSEHLPMETLVVG